MKNANLTLNQEGNSLTLNFFGELSIYTISPYQKTINKQFLASCTKLVLDLQEVSFMDTGAALYLHNLQKALQKENVEIELLCQKSDILQTLALVAKRAEEQEEYKEAIKPNFVEKIGKVFYQNYSAFFTFIAFLGELFISVMRYTHSLKSIRYKEIAFEINESGVKAISIVALTSFLVGVVVAYQSAYQLKIYGANIFIVDMLGLTILRELAPMMTAIVIAGRSGSAFTAQIGAMKITEELDAMRTMGFDPYLFLVLPRVIALMIAVPILIFIADIAGVLGGMLIASVDLNITADLFIDRFNDVIAAKHFFVGIVKGPFFAFLIASIAIYRGLMVKNDTQSIGYNTTKSVVEAIFAVIVCDALFSIAFTHLGI